MTRTILTYVGSLKIVLWFCIILYLNSFLDFLLENFRSVFISDAKTCSLIFFSPIFTYDVFYLFCCCVYDPQDNVEC